MAARRRRWRKFLFGSAIACLGVGLFLAISDRVVAGASEGRIFHSADQVPAADVGIVLGTAPVLQDRKNLYFEGRMTSAAQLYHAGKVKKILVSGDNGRKEYSEPDAMRDALLKRGVPARDIVLDYAGFRTLDSIVRARDIFQVRHCTIVTDTFHLPRALYIADNIGLESAGLCAVEVPTCYAPWLGARETLARSLVVLDVKVLRTRPKFLGRVEPILISSAR